MEVGLKQVCDDIAVKMKELKKNVDVNGVKTGGLGGSSPLTFEMNISIE